SASIARPERRPKRADLAVEFLVSTFREHGRAASALPEASDVLHLPRGRLMERRAAGRRVRGRDRGVPWVVRISRRVFQRLLPERPTPSAASRLSPFRRPGSRASPRENYVAAS